MSLSSPTFTVVMPAHNAEATVESAVRSVLRQTRQDFELVVVDDGSTDGTRERIAPFLGDGRVRLITQSQSGPGAARNAAIRAGSAELVSMLDADDLWLPLYLERMESALRADPQAGFAYTNAWVLDESSGRIRRRLALSEEPATPPGTARELMLLLAERNFIYTSTTVRRAVLDRVGGYDERFRNGEDYELWLRIATRGYRAARAAGTLAVHRDHARSLTSETATALRRAIDLYAAIATEHEDERVRRIAEEARAALQRRLQRLAEPTPWQRIGAAAHGLYLASARRFDWLDRPPDEVARLLAAVSG